MTQTQQILAHLETGQPITPRDALAMFGCVRLAARIKDLRDQGHQITDHRRGSGHSVYRLDSPAQRELFGEQA